jgi:subfamily B ATP-binding cassette protein MsbA
VLYGAILFAISWKLSLIVAVIFPLTSFLLIRTTKRLRRSSENSLEQYQQIRSYSINTLDSLYLTKTYDKEAYEQEEFAQSLSNSLASQYEETKIGSALDCFSSISNVFLLLATALFLPFMTNISGGQNTVPEILVFFIVLRRIAVSINALSQLDIAFSTNTGQLQAISRQLYTRNKFLVCEGKTELHEIKQGISFRNVSFNYGSTKALDNLDLFIPFGQHTAIVGRNGSGKSTIANLILRHYDVPDEKLLVDDRDIKLFSISSIRQRITLIPQKTFLLDGTIRDNLVYGAPDKDSISDAAIIETLKKCALMNLVEDRELGLDTLVAGNGDGFSGGERQLLTIARAFFRPADVYILDEVGTSLDEYSLIEVQAALKELTNNKTCVTITHRLSDVVHADKIYLMKEGRLLESGTLQELLERESEFKDIWHQQTKAWQLPFGSSKSL